MSWICRDCGCKHGKPRDGVSTFHVGKCGWCKQEKAVTEDRDYGYPAPLKENDDAT
jgi:hypothetical protein